MGPEQGCNDLEGGMGFQTLKARNPNVVPYTVSLSTSRQGQDFLSFTLKS